MNYYIIMATIGSLAALSLYFFLIKKVNYPVGLSVFAYISSVFGLFAGGRLFGYIASWIYEMNTGEKIMPGFVFYGGLFGFLGVFFILQKAMFKSSSPFLFDCVAVTIPLFHCFGRIGCFLSGCCTGFLGAIPVQLMESFGNLIIFSVLILLKTKQKAKGKLLWIYLVSYAVLRFFTEFFRNDEIRGFIGALSFSQGISILVVCFVTGFILNKTHLKKPMGM